ncbi:MAG TPA: tyrosine-type recombinase/integrase [Devosia sp.]|jgi:integrase|uniref:tyrosine-type recombinase/integrase n=1 Tax=Devosia sp. TaxID=1871048 RepID=UPI002DDD5A35|nr:tyrosine-type recombinase/integrase [Devosia sp.]HEV2517145.1 tyrosine-type recombinase/integrase [Devosia sp.]
MRLSTTTDVESCQAQGNHPVAGVAGLQLQVRVLPREPAPLVRKSWTMRYRLNGQRRFMGLGPYPLIGLTEAKRRATKARVQLLDRVDPINARRGERPAKPVLTFEQATAAYIKSHKASWSNAKHGDTWEGSLKLHAFPVIGKLAVDQIELSHIIKILEPIWSTKPTTAGKVRGRIERVLDWCRVEGHRPDGPNPAEWKGNLEHRLPPLARVLDVEHRVAVPWRDVPKVFARLTAFETTPSGLLQFIMLTAARYGEAANMMWDDVDLDAGVWTVPADALKSRREHRVPLSPAAVDILLREAGNRERLGLVFRGRSPRRPVSDPTLRKLLRKFSGITDADVHGLRSSFRDWAADTKRSREAAELSLAHVIAGGAEAAYWRSDLLDERRELMGDWAMHLTGLGRKTA